MKWHNPFSRLSVWYFSKKTLPYWGIILLDCLSLLFSGLLVYALNNGLVPIVSYNYGARKKKRLVGSVQFGLVLAVCIWAPVMVFSV